MRQFKCGICKEKDRYWMTRKGLRDHLKIHVKRELFNTRDERETPDRWRTCKRREWVIMEEWK